MTEKADEPKGSWFFPLLIGMILGGAAVFILGQLPELRTGWFWQTQAEATKSTPTCTPTPTPVKLSGSGGGNTTPFCLAGGAYDVTLTTEVSCVAFYALKIASTSESVTALAASTRAITQVNHLYNIPGGYQYYVEATSNPDCPWTMSLTPQPG